MEQYEVYEMELQESFAKVREKDRIANYIKDIVSADEWISDLISRDHILREDLFAVKRLLVDLLAKIRKDKECEHIDIIAKPLEVNPGAMTIKWNLFCEGCALVKEKMSQLNLDVPLIKIGKSIKFEDEPEK